MVDVGRETLVPIPDVGDAIDTDRLPSGSTSGIESGITSGLTKLVRPVRDGTYRYDSYRQRMAPLVYHV